MTSAPDYQAINVTKDNALEDTWAVVRLVGNESISRHESEADAILAIKRYRDWDAIRAGRETRT